MELGLDRQVVFVAGSSRGIGRAIAEAVLTEGARVVLTGRDEGSLRRTEAEFARSGYAERVLAIPGDYSDSTVIAAGLQRAVTHFGGIHHWVANMGTGSGDRGWQVSEGEWQRLFEQNFFAAVRQVQAVLPYLLDSPSGGSILFISSIVAVEATPAPLPYSAAKAALLNYSKNLARQLGPKNIRVNSIAPGNIHFPGGTWERLAESRPSAVAVMLESEVPQRRFGAPTDIASLAAYLCSARAGFCTAGCYIVDGGQTRSI